MGAIVGDEGGDVGLLPEAFIGGVESLEEGGTQALIEGDFPKHEHSGTDLRKKRKREGIKYYYS